MGDKGENRIQCKYGKECYQKNPEHLKKYIHPSKRESLNASSETPKKLKTTNHNHESNSNSQDESENLILEELPVDIKERIKLLFLVEMPSDFYDFYEFCKSLSSDSPNKALKPLNLELVGPFDAFNRLTRNFTKNEALIHFRYFYDPPEFQTVLKGEEKDQLHYGYFRDDPKELPCFVAKNEAAVGPVITCVAGNLFGAVNVHANEVKSSADIFRKMQIQKIQSALIKWSKDKKYSLDTVTSEIKSRRSKVLAKTFNNIGIVAPYDKKSDVGYRTLPVSDKELNTILKQLASSTTEDERKLAWSKLQPVITAANIANDECDFATSLELGIDLFAFGEPLVHNCLEQILCTTYGLLQRNEFTDILKAHLKKRSKVLRNLSTIV